MKRLASILLVVGLLFAVAPVSAQEEVNALPQINTPKSGRGDAITMMNGQVFEVGQGRFAGDRQHLTVIDYQAGITREVITIGQQVYYRENQATRWKATTLDKVEFPTGVLVAEPYTLVEGARFFRVDDATINGTATRQYHIEVPRQNIPADAGPVTYAAGDIFVGTADGYIHKNQFKVSGVDPQEGPFSFEGYFVLGGFDQPITIAPPPSNVVDMQHGPLQLPALYFALRQVHQP